MFKWILIAVIASLVFWILWGKALWAEYLLYRSNKKMIRAGEGIGVAVNEVGQLIGVADTIAHGDGNLFSRSIGAFSSLVPQS
jgi:hypothetical protein